MIYRTNVVCHSRNVRPSSPKSLSNENSVFLPIIMKPLSYSWSNTTLEAKLIPETKSTHFLIICPFRDKQSQYLRQSENADLVRSGVSVKEGC